MADDVLPASPATVTDIGVRDISLELFRAHDGTQSARYSVQVLRSDNSIEVRAGDAVPHLTNAEVNGLVTLINRLRTKARTAWGNG